MSINAAFAAAVDLDFGNEPQYYSLKKIPCSFNPTNPKSPAEFLEKQAELLSISQAYLDYIKDVTLQLEENFSHLKLLYDYLSKYVKENPEALLMFGILPEIWKEILPEKEKAALTFLQQKYDINITIDILQSIYRKNKGQQSSLEILRKQQEEILKEEIALLQGQQLTAQEWIGYFKHLLRRRINRLTKAMEQRQTLKQMQQTEALPSKRPQDQATLSIFDQFLVLPVAQSCEVLERKLLIVFNCLPVDSLSDLDHYLKIPTLKAYLLGYTHSIEKPGFFIRFSEEERFLNSYATDLDTQVDRDYEYFEEYLLVDYIQSLCKAEIPQKKIVKPQEKKRKKKREKAKKASSMAEGTIEEERAAAVEEGILRPEESVIDADEEIEVPIQDAVSAPAEMGSSSMADGSIDDRSAIPKENEDLEFEEKENETEKSASLRRHYVGKSTGKREARIAAMIAKNNNSESRLDYKIRPLKKITLTGEAATIYQNFFANIATFTEFDLHILMDALRENEPKSKKEKDKEKIGKGNGSARSIAFTLGVEQDGEITDEITLRLTYHAPHPHNEFGPNARGCIKEKLERWNLAPDQGYIICE